MLPLTGVRCKRRGGSVGQDTFERDERHPHAMHFVDNAHHLRLIDHTHDQGDPRLAVAARFWLGRDNGKVFQPHRVWWVADLKAESLVAVEQAKS